LGKRGKGGR
jgi:hypothetical protein